MTINGAIEKISEALSAARNVCENLGLTAAQRVYYTDSNLLESSEFTAKTAFLFGELTLTCDGLEDGDECIFAICLAQKDGLVDDGELEAAIAEFNGEIAEFAELVGSSDSKISAMHLINERQQNEAEQAAAELMKQIKKTKKKLFFAIGAIVALIAAILIVGAII